jgi:hypothetical protein
MGIRLVPLCRLVDSSRKLRELGFWNSDRHLAVSQGFWVFSGWHLCPPGELAGRFQQRSCCLVSYAPFMIKYER